MSTYQTCDQFKPPAPDHFWHIHPASGDICRPLAHDDLRIDNEGPTKRSLIEQFLQLNNGWEILQKEFDRVKEVRPPYDVGDGVSVPIGAPDDAPRWTLEAFIIVASTLNEIGMRTFDMGATMALHPH